ncbi:hypothetical protein D6D28_10431 [Aureobasidium pullulans]|uniref:Uncharacterized protein n=1 Tax=Aureobasidium pullulans TaxID=5580 RepID=A0A4S8S267_AURPU|nr:hypothetical protein D6D28_10431 [Aureobasidium pullulans]
MGDNELSKRWKRPKKRTTPVLERILVRNFNGSCAEIQRSPAESAQADLEDALTRYGGCLIKQLREESFLPENGVFRMNDIVEVGGAELKLSDGNRFLPSTQIRFLGSYFPAIIIKVVTADRYRKGLEETRRAMLTMLGKIRIAIVIKIERSPPRAAEASGRSTNNTNAKSTTTPEDERLSMNDRITVKLLQLSTRAVASWWHCISPKKKALHDLALSYRINGTPHRGRPRNMDHVYLPDVEFHEIDYTRPPRPCIPSQMQPPPGLPPRSRPSSSSQFASTLPSHPPPSSALQSQLPSGLPRQIPLSPLSQVRNN